MVRVHKDSRHVGIRTDRKASVRTGKRDSDHDTERCRSSSQPRSATRHHRRGRAHPLASTAPDADPEQPLVPRAGDRWRRDRVPGIEQRRDARRPRAAGRFRQPGRERSARTAPARRRRSIGQDHPPGPDGVPERAAGCVDRAEGPDRHPGKPGRGHRPARPLHADRPRPVRVEPGAGGLGRHADPASARSPAGTAVSCPGARSTIAKVATRRPWRH